MSINERHEQQILIFDADDTLWENNILFERVIEDFLDWLAHPTLDRVQIRGILNDIERANASAHGYGSTVFLRSLADTFHHLQQRPVDSRENDEMHALAKNLLEHRIDLVPGVADTLTELGRRHELLLLTKGDASEQQAKIDASGLGHHFRDAVIVAEKNVQTYQELVRDRALPSSRTWMIGNSPKSDILPARAAGLRAVFIPNENTWVLEHDELDPTDDQVLQLPRFTDLLEHF